MKWSTGRQSRNPALLRPRDVCQILHADAKERGLPSQFEAAFVSMAHTSADVEKTLEAVKKSFKGL